MFSSAFLILLFSCVSAETETVKASVKSGNTKFSCTFTLASDGSAVTIGASKAVCTPNKPSNKKVINFKVSTDKADYTLSFNINPDKINKAKMALKAVVSTECAPGFTRVCPSGARGACPDEMFSFCPYNGSPAAEADTWACSCLHTSMLELDVQTGVSPLGECHGECVCISGILESITTKQKPAFLGPTDMPSYCQQAKTQTNQQNTNQATFQGTNDTPSTKQTQKPTFQGTKDTPSTK